MQTIRLTRTSKNGKAVRGTATIPNIPTGVEQVSQDPMTNSQKLIKDGLLLILRDGKRYTITGQIVQ